MDGGILGGLFPPIYEKVLFEIFVFKNWNHLLGDTSYALPSKLTNWQTSYHRGGAY